MQIPDNKLSSVRRFFVSKLENTYSAGEIRELFEALVLFYLKLRRTQMLMEPDYRLTESEMLHFTRAIKRLLKNEPLQYIIGEVEFAGLKLKINRSVLIPRPETEELCQIILSQHDGNRMDVIDLCTGSGCIALALKSARPHWQVEGVDLSSDALSIAKENASMHQLQVNFSIVDVLNVNVNQWGERTIDLIVSNPPYVRKSEAIDMRPEVLNHEPHMALFVDDDDALIFYKRVIEIGYHRLNPGGFIYFEINEYKAEETLMLFENFPVFQAELIQDFAGKWRFIRASKR